MRPSNTLCAFMLAGLGGSVARAQTAFVINNDLSCNTITASIDSATCNDSNVCEMGAQATVSGTMTFADVVPTSATITVKGCFMGSSLDSMCRTFTEDDVNLCEEAGLTGVDGNECPAAGSYTFNADFEIPQYDRSNLGSGWWIKVTTTIVDNDGQAATTTCTNTIKATSSSSSSWRFWSVSSFLGLAALATVLVHGHRRRRVGTAGKINLLAEESRHTGQFEMMKEQQQMTPPGVSV